MPERCVCWPARRTLIAADLHLGKCDTFRAAGLSMPGHVAAAVLDEQLARLDLALKRTGAERLLVVGDLLHAPAGLTRELVGRVASWRAGCRAAITLIAGNHDRRVDLVRAEWRLDLAGPGWREGPFLFLHDPAECPAGEAAFAWCGHVHPTVRLASGVDAVKLPCFVLDRARAVIPAFSRFTAGAVVRGGPGRRLFAVADGAVIPV